MRNSAITRTGAGRLNPPRVRSESDIRLSRSDEMPFGKCVDSGRGCRAFMRGTCGRAIISRLTAQLMVIPTYGGAL
jgi:hypothetical protein